MATRLKPSRINVDNTPHVWEGAAYKSDDDFHWSMGGWDMSYRDFEWNTLTWNSITIEDISNNITPSSNFTVSAWTELKPGIEYVLRVNTGSTPYTMTLGTGVTNPNLYKTELKPNTVNQFKFIATSTSQLELEGVDSAVVSEINWGEIDGTLSNQTDLQNALNSKADKEDVNVKVFHIASTNDITNAQAAIDWWEQGRLTGGYTPIIEFWWGKELYGLLAVYDGFQAIFTALAPETTQGTSKTTTSIKEIAFSLTGTPWQPQTVTAISTSNYLDINYLDTNASYSSPYTPSTPWNPATKKYVDDNVNTKTFTLSSTSDLVTAQAAYDWYRNWNNPIILYTNNIYILSWVSSGFVYFVANNEMWGTMWNSRSTVSISTVTFQKDWNTIEAISTTAKYAFNFIETDKNYSTAYTPQYNGSPATKKYVDDHGVPTTGTTGYVLTKNASGYWWAALPSASGITNNTTGTTSTLSSIWVWSEAEYTALGTGTDGVMYFVF